MTILSVVPYELLILSSVDDLDAVSYDSSQLYFNPPPLPPPTPHILPLPPIHIPYAEFQGIFTTGILWYFIQYHHFPWFWWLIDFIYRVSCTILKIPALRYYSCRKAPEIFVCKNVEILRMLLNYFFWKKVETFVFSWTLFFWKKWKYFAIS